MFDRFDICDAYYWFMANYHNGQWSKEYALSGTFHRLGFRPSPLAKGPDSENAQDIYNTLVETKGANIRDRR